MKINSSKEPARPGDLLLFYNAGGVTRLITWFTHSPFYHIGICAGDECVVEARPRGVVLRDLRAANEHDYLVIPTAGNGGTHALEWARQQVGDTYDVLGIAVLILERLFNSLHLNYRPPGTRFSCCELVICAFREAGVELLPGLDPSAIAPADFAVLLPAAERANRRLRRKRRKI